MSEKSQDDDWWLEGAATLLRKQAEQTASELEILQRHSPTQLPFFDCHCHPHDSSPTRSWQDQQLQKQEYGSTRSQKDQMTEMTHQNVPNILTRVSGEECWLAECVKYSRLCLMSVQLVQSPIQRLIHGTHQYAHSFYVRFLHC
jgi:hypothetical protein